MRGNPPPHFRIGGARPARVLVLCEAGVQPTKEILAFLRSVRGAAGARTPVLVGLVAEDGGGFADAPADEVLEWRRRLETLGDPYLGVETVAEAP